MTEIPPTNQPFTGAGTSRVSSATRDYLHKVTLFSRNARLYMVHIVGMDTIHGTWEVIFNLYLLAIGFGIEFIGLRLLIAGIAGAVASIPAGLVSDRIGRKASFILGDGVGAVVAMVNITTTNSTILLITPVIGTVFGRLHGVTEPAFMAENTEPPERVHLFSVSASARTAAAMVGSLLAGALPALALTLADTIAAYRAASFIGIVLWFLSLIPALLLRERPRFEADHPSTVPAGSPLRRLMGLGNIRHPRRVAQLVLTGALLSAGAGFTIPLFNVFFHEGLHAHELAIGGTFAAGSAALALASLLAPFLAERLGKVPSVFTTRLASVPFILLIAASPELSQNAFEVGLTVAGFAFIARTTLMNMSAPVEEAFAMEILDPRERATQVGIEGAVASILLAAGGFLGARMMAGGDFQTPFLIMAACYLASTLLFFTFFRGLDRPSAETEPFSA
ncbi:MAG: MFS transporter [Anaerolineae bacterium]